MPLDRPSHAGRWLATLLLVLAALPGCEPPPKWTFDLSARTAESSDGGFRTAAPRDGRWLGAVILSDRSLAVVRSGPPAAIDVVSVRGALTGSVPLPDDPSLTGARRVAVCAHPTHGLFILPVPGDILWIVPTSGRQAVAVHLPLRADTLALDSLGPAVGAGAPALRLDWGGAVRH